MNLPSGTQTVLTSPVRLAPPLAPLLTTQRVAVSVTPGTRLAIPQHVTVTPAPRAPGLHFNSSFLGYFIWKAHRSKSVPILEVSIWKVNKHDRRPYSEHNHTNKSGVIRNNVLSFIQSVCGLWYLHIIPRWGSLKYKSARVTITEPIKMIPVIVQSSIKTIYYPPLYFVLLDRRFCKIAGSQSGDSSGAGQADWATCTGRDDSYDGACYLHRRTNCHFSLTPTSAR